MKFDQISLGANQRLNFYRQRIVRGLSPNPNTYLVLQWLQQNRASISALLPNNFAPDNAIYLDLSAPNSDQSDDMKSMATDINTLLQKTGASVALGRYDEDRHCYQSEVFKNQSESRSVHIGVDIFVPPGTTLYAPLNATVHSFQNNDNPLDYGPTIILQHQISADLSFFSLYGHLSHASLMNLAVGKTFAAGENFATVGAMDENGGWPPHVHVQLIVDMLDFVGDFPGVISLEEADLWMDLCPNPFDFLKLPEQTNSNVIPFAFAK